MKRTGRSNRNTVVFRSGRVGRSTAPVQNAGTPCGHFRDCRSTCTGSARTDPRRQREGVSSRAQANSRSIVGNGEHRIICLCNTYRRSSGEQDRTNELRVGASATRLRVPVTCDCTHVDGRRNAFRSHHSLGGLNEIETFCNTATHGVVLISGECHSRQNTDDRYNDHQFDECKTLLQIALHKKLLGGRLQLNNLQKDSPGLTCIQHFLCQLVAKTTEQRATARHSVNLRRKPAHVTFLFYQGCHQVHTLLRFVRCLSQKSIRSR